jgi:molybdopterin-binding protein
VTAVDDLGIVVVLQVACGNLDLRTTITRSSLREMGIRTGDEVVLTFKASAVRVFPQKS